VKLSTRLAAALLVVALIGLLGANLGGGDGPKRAAAIDNFASLPGSPPPALKIGAPERLSPGRFVSRWTTIRTAALAHIRPAAESPVIARIAPETPEGTPNALLVLRPKSDSNERLWVQVRLPVLPNGRVGWLMRHALGAYQSANTHLVVNREYLTATLYRRGKEVFSAPVGIGTDAWPTPPGEFMIRSELTRYASPFYGPVAFGTTARSAVLTDWPGGGFVGIHGTNEPQLIPGRVSHGCIRLRNADILRLVVLMPVGTPLTIR
jgi:L,D-transpeptidase catalytic domain